MHSYRVFTLSDKYKKILRDSQSGEKGEDYFKLPPLEEIKSCISADAAAAFDTIINSEDEMENDHNDHHQMIEDENTEDEDEGDLTDHPDDDENSLADEEEDEDEEETGDTHEEGINSTTGGNTNNNKRNTNNNNNNSNNNSNKRTRRRLIKQHGKRLGEKTTASHKSQHNNKINLSSPSTNNKVTPTVPVKPILMCFICKLSFVYVKSFTAHASAEHNIIPNDEESALLAAKNSSAIIQGVGQDKEPLLSFLEPKSEVPASSTSTSTSTTTTTTTTSSSSSPPPSSPSLPELAELANLEKIAKAAVAASQRSIDLSSSSSSSSPSLSLVPPPPPSSTPVATTTTATTTTTVCSPPSSVSPISTTLVMKQQTSPASSPPIRLTPSSTAITGTSGQSLSPSNLSSMNSVNVAAAVAASQRSNDLSSSSSSSSSPSLALSLVPPPPSSTPVAVTATNTTVTTTVNPLVCSPPSSSVSPISTLVMKQTSPASSPPIGLTPPSAASITGTSGQSVPLSPSTLSSMNSANVAAAVAAVLASAAAQQQQGSSSQGSVTPSGSGSLVTATPATYNPCSHHPEGVECPKCDIVLGSSRSLGGHMTMMHSRNSCKTLKCPKCNWHYKYQETLAIHMKEKHPENEMSCVFCLTGQKHPRLARGETYNCGYKPYRCEICNYSTTTKGNLSIHTQSDKHANNVRELERNGSQAEGLIQQSQLAAAVLQAAASTRFMLSGLPSGQSSGLQPPQPPPTGGGGGPPTPGPTGNNKPENLSTRSQQFRSQKQSKSSSGDIFNDLKSDSDQIKFSNDELTSNMLEDLNESLLASLSNQSDPQSAAAAAALFSGLGLTGLSGLSSESMLKQALLLEQQHIMQQQLAAAVASMSSPSSSSTAITTTTATSNNSSSNSHQCPQCNFSTNSEVKLSIHLINAHTASFTNSSGGKSGSGSGLMVGPNTTLITTPISSNSVNLSSPSSPKKAKLSPSQLSLVNAAAAAAGGVCSTTTSPSSLSSSGSTSSLSNYVILCPLCQSPSDSRKGLESHLMDIHNVTKEAVDRLMFLVTTTTSDSVSRSEKILSSVKDEFNVPINSNNNNLSSHNGGDDDNSSLECPDNGDGRSDCGSMDDSIDGSRLMDDCVNLSSQPSSFSALNNCIVNMSTTGIGSSSSASLSATKTVRTKSTDSQSSSSAVSDRHVYKFRCTQCSLAFKTNEKLQLHKQYHYVRAATQCCLCRRSFRSVESLRKHVETTHPNMSEEELDVYRQSLANNPMLLSVGRNGGGILDPATTELLKKESARTGASGSTVGGGSSSNNDDDESESLMMMSMMMDTGDVPMEGDEAMDLVVGGSGAGGSSSTHSNNLTGGDCLDEEMTDLDYKSPSSERLTLEDQLNSQTAAEDGYNDPTRKYKCHRCKVAFTRQSYLTAHNKTLLHRKGEKLSYPMEKYLDPNRPHKCDLCKESFTQKTILQVHNNSVSHIHRAAKAKEAAAAAAAALGGTTNKTSTTKPSKDATINCANDIIGSNVTSSSPPLSSNGIVTTTASHSSSSPLISSSSTSSSSTTTTSSSAQPNCSTTVLPVISGSVHSMTSSDSIDKKPYRCNICKVAYNNGPALDIHIRSVLHQTRATKIKELTLSGQIDPTIPLIERPELTSGDVSVTSVSLSKNVDLLSLSNNGQGKLNDLTEQQATSLQQAMALNLATGGQLLLTNPAAMAAAAAAAAAASSNDNANVNSTSSSTSGSNNNSGLFSCNRCGTIVTSHETFLQHQQICSLFGPRGLKSMSGKEGQSFQQQVVAAASALAQQAAQQQQAQSAQEQLAAAIRAASVSSAANAVASHHQTKYYNAPVVKSKPPGYKNLLETWGFEIVMQFNENHQRRRKVPKEEKMDEDKTADEAKDVLNSSEKGKESTNATASSGSSNLPEINRSKCDFCNKEFSSIWVLKAHREEVHSSIVPISYVESFAEEYRKDYDRRHHPLTHHHHPYLSSVVSSTSSSSSSSIVPQNSTINSTTSAGGGVSTSAVLVSSSTPTTTVTPITSTNVDSFVNDVLSANGTKNVGLSSSSTGGGGADSTSVTITPANFVSNHLTSSGQSTSSSGHHYVRGNGAGGSGGSGSGGNKNSDKSSSSATSMSITAASTTNSTSSGANGSSRSGSSSGANGGSGGNNNNPGGNPGVVGANNANGSQAEMSAQMAAQIQFSQLLMSMGLAGMGVPMNIPGMNMNVPFAAAAAMGLPPPMIPLMMAPHLDPVIAAAFNHQAAQAAGNPAAAAAGSGGPGAGGASGSAAAGAEANFFAAAQQKLIAQQQQQLSAAAAAAAAQQQQAQAQQPKRARTRITDDQLKVLRQYFDINNSPTEEALQEMSEKSGLPLKVIKHWFRNTLFKERQRNKDSPYNFNNPPSTFLNLEEYEKTGEAKVIPIDEANSTVTIKQEKSESETKGETSGGHFKENKVTINATTMPNHTPVTSGGKSNSKANKNISSVSDSALNATLGGDSSLNLSASSITPSTPNTTSATATLNLSVNEVKLMSTLNKSEYDFTSSDDEHGGGGRKDDPVRLDIRRNRESTSTPDTSMTFSLTHHPGTSSTPTTTIHQTCQHQQSTTTTVSGANLSSTKGASGSRYESFDYAKSYTMSPQSESSMSSISTNDTCSQQSGQPSQSLFAGLSSLTGTSGLPPHLSSSSNPLQMALDAASHRAAAAAAGLTSGGLSITSPPTPSGGSTGGRGGGGSSGRGGGGGNSGIGRDDSSSSGPSTGTTPGKRANRTRFTDYQIKVLQEFFESNAYPKDDDLEYLSKLLNLSPRVIVVWFQNARQKARKVYENQPTSMTDDDSSQGKLSKTAGLTYQCKKCCQVFQRYYDLIKHSKSACFKDENPLAAQISQIKAAQEARAAAASSPGAASISSAASTPAPSSAKDLMNDSLPPSLVSPPLLTPTGLNNSKDNLSSLLPDPKSMKGDGGSSSASSSSSTSSSISGQQQHQHLQQQQKQQQQRAPSPSNLVATNLSASSASHHRDLAPSPTTSEENNSRPSSPSAGASSSSNGAFRCEKCGLVFARFDLCQEHQLVHLMHPSLFPPYPPTSPFGILQYEGCPPGSMTAAAAAAAAAASGNAEAVAAVQRLQQQQQFVNSLTGLNSSSTSSSSGNNVSLKRKRERELPEDEDSFDSISGVGGDGSVSGASTSATGQLTEQQQRDKRLRTTILPEQLDYLYQKYENESNPSRKMLESIAKEIGLKKRVVQVWFQNTRARERKGQFRAHQQAIHKRCPFCRALFKARSALESHLATRHADQYTKGDINIDALPDGDPNEDTSDGLSKSEMYQQQLFSLQKYLDQVNSGQFKDFTGSNSGAAPTSPADLSVNIKAALGLSGDVPLDLSKPDASESCGGSSGGYEDDNPIPDPL